jgi:RimJ/RimL family protein N-acetyltransferase
MHDLMLLSGDLSQTSITSARLVLRATTAADAADAFQYSNAAIAKFMSWSPPTSKEELESIWQGSHLRMKAGTELSLIVRLTSANEFVGAVGLHAADGAMLETGIWIKEPAQRHGYGREAVAAVIKWASEKFRPSGFLYPVVDENIPSRRLAQALGGEVIGTRRMHKPGDKERTQLLYRIPAPV